MSEICHIVAVDKNFCIGKNNALPWHIPTDLKFFKQTTMSCPVIMGRKTFESIGRLLPKRLNVVLSRQADYQLPEGALLMSSLDEALSETKEAERVFIIGGAEIYKMSQALVDRIFITHVDTEIEAGDAYYPELPAKTEIISRTEDFDKYKLIFEEHLVKK